MFKRRWIWFGRLVSDEGFALSYGHNSVRYSDDRGTFEFGFEDGFLFPIPFRVPDNPERPNQAQLEKIIDRVVRGIRAEGLEVQVYRH